jgi:polar amino acid transport system substrate-binding protein
LRAARDDAGLPFVVGFNRRHAPQAARLREHVRARGHPFELLFRVNAGLLPRDHWLNDPNDGGGRLLGEGCHFVDFACWFGGAVPERLACVMRASAGEPLASAQSFTVSLGFGDGAIATILYSAGGSKRFSKEYVEGHSNGRSGSIDDFKEIVLGNGRSESHSARGRDKGHVRQFAHFREVLEGRAQGSEPDSLDSMAVTLAALRSAQTGLITSLDRDDPAHLPA